MDMSKAHADDLAEILEVARTAFGLEDYEDYVKEEISAGMTPGSLYPISFFVSRDNGRIVNYGGIAPAMILRDVFELRLGATLPEYQRKGLMSRIVHARLDEAKRMSGGRRYMVVTTTRHPGIYSKYGFREVFENERGYKYMILTRSTKGPRAL